MSIKVIVGDDHAVMRDGIRAFIESSGKDIEIIGEGSNGKEVLEIAEKSPADVYIIDISMPILNGIETTDRLIKMDPKSKVIILSMHDSRKLVDKAFKSGAKGYIVKSRSAEEIIHAIFEVYNDKFYLSPDISEYIIEGYMGKDHQFEGKKELELTRREREVLQLIAEGFTDKEIAKELNLSPKTVHFHRSNIMQKLDIHKQADLIRYAIKEGIAKL